MSDHARTDPLSWPRKNRPEDIAARQAALRALPHWEPLVDVFEFPFESGAAPFLNAMELLTGYVALPVGVVGPLPISLGVYERDERGDPREVDRRGERVFVPIAHTEGGLSASMQRGVIAAAMSGGFRTFVLHDRITRDSCFFFDSTADAVAFARWIETQAEAMRDWLLDPANPLRGARSEGGVAPISRHAVLREVRTHVVGTYCHVLYRFTTGDACGPNMMTRNAYALNRWFVPERATAAGVPVPRDFVLEANMGGDKKPSYLYYQEGHGKTVIAETTLTRSALTRVLRVTPERVVELERAGAHGSHASGMQSLAFTPASAIAAIFAATGQDLGMVGTSSMAHGVVTPVEDGLHFSIRLPGLEVATLGGGTGLPHARSYLRLMGCEGPGSVFRFAQIVAAATLALEISATASMAVEGSENFYRAHWERGGLRERVEGRTAT